MGSVEYPIVLCSEMIFLANAIRSKQGSLLK